MRIGIDAKTLSKRYTGIAIYVSEVIRHFTEIDSSDEFFLYSNKPIELSFNLPGNFHVRLFKAFSGTIGVITTLSKLLVEDSIDIFWGTEHCIPLGKQPFKRVVTIHDLAIQHNYKLGTRYNYLIQRFVGIPSIKCADMIIAISKATAADVIKYVGSDKVTVIYNGDSPYNYMKRDFTLEQTNVILSKWNLKQYSYFLFVGTIEPRKNLVTLIKAFNRFRERSEKSIKLVFAGGLGWRYNPILKEIRLSPYKNDIIRTGYISDEEKECLYKYANSLTFPSVYEGFGFPIVEAMSLGIPVVTSSISSMPEVAGECALYLKNIYDDAELASLLSIVANYTNDQREIIKKKNMMQALKFSRKECACAILNLFHSI